MGHSGMDPIGSSDGPPWPELLLQSQEDWVSMGEIAREATIEIIEFVGRSENEEDIANFIIGRIWRAIIQGRGAAPLKNKPAEPKNCSKCSLEIAPEKRITIPGKEDLCHNCYKAGPKTICVDLDGVLAQYSGWQGPDHIGEPMPGAGEFLKALTDMGFEIVIHTTRDQAKVAKWLIENKISRIIDIAHISKITNQKVTAMAYIDDRAICFQGCFAETLTRLKYFSPWWKEGKQEVKTGICLGNAGDHY